MVIRERTMHIGHLPENFSGFITKKRGFFLSLVSEGIDVNLISKAIHYMTLPPAECGGPVFEKAAGEEIPEEDLEESRKIWSAVQHLTELLNNSVLDEDEREMVLSILERINDDYEIEWPDRKTLLELVKSQERIEKVEDYSVYPDDGVGWYIDRDPAVQLRCQGKLVWMLYNYIKEFADVIPGKVLVGRTPKFRQKDIFELVSEIMNLRWPGTYDYKTVKRLYEDYGGTKT